MKLTKRQLQRTIQEELEAVLREGLAPSGFKRTEVYDAAYPDRRQEMWQPDPEKEGMNIGASGWEGDMTPEFAGPKPTELG